MNLNTPLIVPIDLQALCVGYPDETANAAVLSPQADFSMLPWNDGGSYTKEPYTSSAVMSGAAPFDGQITAQFGIHLHWALPDGLTQSIPPPSDPTAQPQFLSVPNRWMLTRIILDLSDPGAPVTTLKSWVIESDRLLDAQDPSLPVGFKQPTVPLNPRNGGITYNYIGQAFPLESWSETSAPRLTPLTATGYGQPAFAAYYPNSSTVFGFLDTFEDVTTYNAAASTVHYQVTGWYSGAADDPQNGESYTGTDNPFGWAYTAGANPQSTVCNGIITNIPWNPDTQYLNQDANPINVAIGNNSPETFSALLANMNGNKATYPYAELLLNLLQFNYLSKPGLIPDSLQSFEETLHRTGFGPVASGARWTILPDDPADKSLYKQIGSFVKPLATLNKTQAEADEAMLLLNTERTRLFADWYKYLVLTYGNPDNVPSGLTSSNAQQFVKLEAELIKDSFGLYQTSILPALQKAQATLAADLPAGLRLVQNEPRGHYWQSNNPVLILTGEDVKPASRYGMDGAGKPGNLLPCRLENELLTGLSLDAGIVSNSAAITLDLTQLPSLDAAPADAPATLINTLLQETFLLCPLLQNTVAAALVQQGGSGNPATLDFAGTVQALQTAVTALMAGQATPEAGYTGTAPDPIMIFTYAGTPWLPIMMQYSVFYQPVFTVDTAGGSPVFYSETFINDNFTWDKDSIELQYTGTGLNAGVNYTGTVNLTPGASQDLAFAIQHYLDNVPAASDAKELQALLTQVQQLPQLSQGLGGFTESLLMSQQVLQMPVWDPLASTLLQSSFVTPVADAVAKENTIAPLPYVQQFNPVRSGGLQISQIRLIDAFGQYKDYKNPTVYVAQTLQPPSSLTVPGVQAFLPPRITQPAKLDISWKPAGDDNHDSPIIGWVLPNRLDNSIYLYDAGGNAIGELIQPSGTTNVVFMSAAGGANPPGSDLTTALEGLNSQLASVINALYNNGDAGYLSPFIAAVNQALSMIFPPVTSDDQANALLIGQPLVLANISMKLQLLGAPAVDESWYSFADAVSHKIRSDCGLSGIRFPVQLGDLLQMNDGLVGFWPFSAGAADLATFYSLGATASTGPVIAPVQDTIVLTPSPEASPLDFLLLFDPLAPIHATTGILPVHTFKLDPWIYAASLSNLKVTFLTAPILSGANNGSVAMPIPDETQGTWNWITVQAQQWNTMTLQQESSQQATLNYTPQQILEGWLQLSNFEPEKKK